MTPASVWNETMSQPLACTIRNRSSSGAKLEFPHDEYNDEITEVARGDQITLTVNSARERTHVTCVVVWVAGRRCGVRFAELILARLQSLPAGCPVCRAELFRAVERRVDAPADGARYDGGDLEKGAGDGEV